MDAENISPKNALAAFFQRVRSSGYLSLFSVALNGAVSGYTFEMPRQAAEAAHWCKLENQQCKNVYWTVNPVTSLLNKKPAKKDIEHVQWLHVDLDPDCSQSYEVGRALLDKIIGEIFSSELPPTVTLFSGNGYGLFYQLDNPVSLEEGERLNLSLLNYFGGDSGTHNADRGMRVPWTKNYPTASKIAKGYPESPSLAIEFGDTCRLFSPKDIAELTEAASGDSSALKEQTDIEPIPTLSAEEIERCRSQLMALLMKNPKFRNRWEGGIEGLKDSSGSGRDLSIVATLVRNGFTFPQACWVLDEFPHGSVRSRELHNRSRSYHRLWNTAGSGNGAETAISGPVPDLSISEHPAIATLVIQKIGTQNILYWSGVFWIWSHRSAGVWSEVDDRVVLEKIHRVCNELQLDTFKGSIVRSVLDLIATEIFRSSNPFHKECWDRINVRNGELRLTDQKWELFRHEPGQYWNTQIPVEFDTKAEAPRFLKFLDEIFEGTNSPDSRKNLLIELIGYTLLPTAHLEKFVMLYGNGANGKSVLLGVIEDLVGKAQAAAVTPSQLSESFKRAHLYGKLANIVTELPINGQIADAQLKSMTSGELTTAEQKYRSEFEFHPVATFWFGTNSLPRLKDHSDSIYRRAALFDFPNRFDGDSRDNDLRRKLRGELPGILRLALEAIAEVLKTQEFSICEDSDELVRAWRRDNDQVALFVEETCETDPNAVEPIASLFTQYSAWIHISGGSARLNKVTFGHRLENLGYSPARGSGGIRVRKGIKLKPLPEPRPPMVPPAASH